MGRLAKVTNLERLETLLLLVQWEAYPAPIKRRQVLEEYHNPLETVHIPLCFALEAVRRSDRKCQ